MRSLISNIAMAAFLLHALFGCAAHAHADEQNCCSSPLASHEQGHVGCHHCDRSPHQDGAPSHSHSSDSSHQNRCEFSSTAKVELLKQRLLFCAAPLLNIEPLEQQVHSSYCGVQGEELFWGLRPHLAKSVLLI